MPDKLTLDDEARPIGAEHRRFPRAKGLLSGCLVVGPKIVDCVVLDLSLKGARLGVDRPLPAGGAAMMNLNSILRMASPVDFQVKIVWSNETTLGVRFVDAPDVVMAAIGRVLPDEYFLQAPDLS